MRAQDSLVAASGLCSAPPSLPIGARPNGVALHKNKLTLCLAVMQLAGVTCALSACMLVCGVSAAGATNMGGAPGMANDLATGGQGGRNVHGGGGGSGGGSGRN